MDYTKSAVGLTNPKELKDMLDVLKALLKDQETIQEDIDNHIPEHLRAARDVNDQTISELQTEIKAYCESNSVSYQDLEAGYWAIKQKKETVTYLPTLVRATLPEKEASMVIVEAVDKVRMEGLIKGKFIMPEDARKCAKIEESFNYIIKVEPPTAPTKVG